IHGDDIINTDCLFGSSPWIHITREVHSLHLKGINLLAHVKKKVGNGSTTLFWKDPWFADSPFINSFPKLFALECNKNATVADKLHDISMSHSFRRSPRGGVEEEQYRSLVDKVNSVVLSNSSDIWVWPIDSSGDFSVKSARSLIDDFILPTVGSPTR
nr:RNA-directed DNA polymerase, eukaryota, reverse transcriptase zinc-binding domain protein [Tanacetum cinerariifolium]